MVSGAIRKMLDLGFVRNNLELVEEKLAQRGMTSRLDKFREVDQKRRSALTRVEALKNQGNRASEEIARIKKAQGDAQPQIQQMKSVSDEIAVLDEEVRVLDEEMREILVTLPNLPHPSVPVG